MTDSGVSVKAGEVSVTDGKVKVGGSEVDVAPSTVMNTHQVMNAYNFELKEENAKAVYKIDSTEDKLLLGFIPIQMERKVTVDASNNNLIADEKPWYAFMAV